MDIKEIALKVAEESGAVGYSPAPLRAVRGYSFTYEQLQNFAEALIESYKAELLKEVGEPVAEFVLCISANGFGTEWRMDESAWWSAVEPERRAKVFTSDQLAAAIIKATKPLEDQLVAAQEEIRASDIVVAETISGLLAESSLLKDQLAKANQLWQIAQGRCDGLEEKIAKAEQRVADACANYVNRFINGDGILNEVWISDIESALRNGEWRKHMKGD